VIISQLAVFVVTCYPDSIVRPNYSVIPTAAKALDRSRKVHLLKTYKGVPFKRSYLASIVRASAIKSAVATLNDSVLKACQNLSNGFAC